MLSMWTKIHWNSFIFLQELKILLLVLLGWFEYLKAELQELALSGKCSPPSGLFYIEVRYLNNLLMRGWEANTQCQGQQNLNPNIEISSILAPCQGDTTVLLFRSWSIESQLLLDCIFQGHREFRDLAPYKAQDPISSNPGILPENSRLFMTPLHSCRTRLFSLMWVRYWGGTLPAQPHIFCEVMQNKHFKEIWPNAWWIPFWKHIKQSSCSMPLRGNLLRSHFGEKSVRTSWGTDLLGSDIGRGTFLCSWKIKFLSISWLSPSILLP